MGDNDYCRNNGGDKTAWLNSTCEKLKKTGLNSNFDSAACLNEAEFCGMCCSTFIGSANSAKAGCIADCNTSLGAPKPGRFL